MLDAVAQLAPDYYEGILAGAGIAGAGAEQEKIALNSLSAVATLEALHPFLANYRAAGRAATARPRL